MNEGKVSQTLESIMLFEGCFDELSDLYPFQKQQQTEYNEDINSFLNEDYPISPPDTSSPLSSLPSPSSSPESFETFPEENSEQNQFVFQFSAQDHPSQSQQQFQQQQQQHSHPLQHQQHSLQHQFQYQYTQQQQQPQPQQQSQLAPKPKKQSSSKKTLLPSPTTSPISFTSSPSPQSSTSTSSSMTFSLPSPAIQQFQQFPQFPQFPQFQNLNENQMQNLLPQQDQQHPLHPQQQQHPLQPNQTLLSQPSPNSPNQNPNPNATPNLSQLQNGNIMILNDPWNQKVAINRLPMQAPQPKTGKKSSHNAIERRYRDNINHKITDLKNCVPNLNEGEKMNKGKILKRATEYIHYLKNSNDRLKEENQKLKELLLNFGGGEELQKHENAILEQEKIEKAQADLALATKLSKKKKDAQKPKTKMVDGVRVFMIATLCVGLVTFGGPFPDLNGNIFHSRVLEGVESPVVGINGFYQDALEFISWLTLRLILITVCLFSVLNADPIIATDSQDYTTCLEKEKQAYSAIKQGNINQARQLISEALSCLGRPLPVSFNDHFFALIWQIFRQISHFVLIGFWMDRLMAQRSTHSRNSYKQAALLHFRLQELYLSQYQPQTLDLLARATNSLALINLMEASEVDPSTLAKVYASAAIQLRLVLPKRLQFLSRYYLNLSRKEFQLVSSKTNHSLVSWLLQPTGYQFFMSNLWIIPFIHSSVLNSKSSQTLDSLQKFTKLYHENMLLNAYRSINKEKSSTSLRLFEEICSSCSLSKDSGNLWWASMGKVICLWKLGKNEEGDQLLLQTENYQSPTTRLQSAITYLLFGKLLYRQLQIEQAMKAADKVTGLLEVKNLNEDSEFELCQQQRLDLDSIIENLCCDNVLEMRLSSWLLVRGISSQSELKKTILNKVIKNCQRDFDVLKGLAHSFDETNRAKLLMLKGIFRSLSGGSAQRTRSLFDKSLKLIQQQPCAYSEGVILTNISRFCPISQEEKKKHLHTASIKFQEIEAIEELKVVEALKSIEY